MTTHLISKSSLCSQRSSAQSGSGHLRVSWSVWYWDVINRSFGPCGSWGGVSEEGDCLPQMPSGHIRLQSVGFEDQMITSYSMLKIVQGAHGWTAGGGDSCRGKMSPKVFRWVPSTRNWIHVNARMQVFPAEHCTVKRWVPLTHVTCQWCNFISRHEQKEASVLTI